MSENIGIGSHVKFTAGLFGIVEEYRPPIGISGADVKVRWDNSCLPEDATDEEHLSDWLPISSVSLR